MRRRVLGLVVLSLALVAVAYLLWFTGTPARAMSPWLLALGSNGLIISLMALGAMRGDRLPRALGWTFAGLFLLCAGSFLAALAMPANEGAGGPLLLGFPLRTAIVLYGVGVLPIAVLPLAYALTFESTLSEAQLQRVRDAYASVRAAREADERPR